MIHTHGDSDNGRMKLGAEETGAPVSTLVVETAVEKPDPDELELVGTGKPFLSGLKLGKAALL